MRAKLLALALLCAAAPAQEQRPNFVLILADDLGWRDLGCTGSELHRTPRLDAMAEQGLRFTQAYANAPNCAPSRACLMTGQLTPRHGIYTVGSSARGKARNRRLIPIENRTTLPEANTTIAELLAPAGYACASIGKWQPPQLVVHDRWQVKQAISSVPCARSSGAMPVPNSNRPVSAPCLLISLARADFALNSRDCGSTLSRVRLTCHSSSGSTIERWIRTCRPSSP